MWFSRRDLLDDAHERRWPNVLVWIVLVGFSFRQYAGETTFDTKLDLTVAPGAFLERTMTAWNPMSAFGELQNQAYGYLFPQGTFFLLGELARVPDWVVQRLWSGLLLVVAYEGARQLFRAIDSSRNRPWLPMVAGLAYAFSPRLLGLSGVLTGEIHPSAVLPWVVLPLILVLQGRLTPLHGSVWSGVAVLMMGGVNATEVLLALPLPALVIATSLRSPEGRRMAVWWPLAVIAATLWWVFGLLTQGRYIPPFLDYIETASATTQPLGWANVTRGADHWLSFIWVGGRPWWEGSYQLATDALLVLLTGMVAAISLLGLFHRNMPYRLPFALSALAGLVLLTLGHVDSFGSPLSGGFRDLLDGALSPFRNIHKLDPVVRLPLALGFAHAAGLLATRLRAGLKARQESGGRLGLVPRRVVRPVVLVAALLLLAASAQPLFTGDLRRPGWKEIPRAWVEAAQYLGRHDDGRRTLVLPGAGFGQQTWGWTIDEPMQALAESPWVSRSQVPLAPGQTIRYLDAIEERIQDGLGSPVLADALARAGIKHVLVRRDLDLWATEAPSPARVDLALSRSPGIDKVASFGSTSFGSQSMIDVFEVKRNIPLLEAVDVTSVKTLAGGPEDVVTAMEAGLLRAGEVTVNSAEPGWEAEPDVVADGFRRRERQFGRLVDATGHVMTQDEEYRSSRAVHDYPGVAEEQRVHARYTSLRTVTASSSSGYVDNLGAIQAQMAPYAALDGSPETYWRSAALEDPVGQWLEIEFLEKRPLTQMRVLASVDGVSGVPIRRLRVDAGGKSYPAEVDPITGEVRVQLDGTPVDRVRLTVTDVLGEPRYAVVALRDVTFEGVEIARTLVLPDQGASGSSAFVFRARPHRRACVDVGLGPQCDAGSGRASEEEFGLDRTFRTASGGRYRVSATVVARSAPATGDLLHPFENRLSASASSTLALDPSVAGQRAVDDNPMTPWIAARGDASPSLDLRWGSPRTISRLQVESSHIDSSAPRTAVIESEDGERREVRLGPDSLGYFEPMRASAVTITFPMPRKSPTGADLPPLGIGELHLEGLERLKTPWNPQQQTGAVCGFGPDLVLDGRRYPTRVTGTLGDVAGGTDLELELCGRRAVRIGEGTHQLTVTSTPQFAVTSLTLEPVAGSPVEEEVRGREVGIERWDANHRAVTVGPGPESVLRIPENVNAGWQATLDGEVLEPLRLDGWQQGFKLDAGEGGLVQLEFIPDRTYATQLGIGALTALGLLALAIGLELRRGRGGRGSRRLSVVPQRRWLGQMDTVTFLALGLGAFLLGGAPLLSGVALGFLLRRRRRALSLVPAGMVALAAGMQSFSSWQEGTVNVAAADWVAAAAIGVFTLGLLRPPGTRRSS